MSAKRDVKRKEVSMMKKLIILGLVILALAMLAGCGETAAQTAPSSANSSDYSGNYYTNPTDPKFK
ncbi:hypothetical protein NO2_1173 [Candidatus Termititenax persephonae]|uniref:Uncharacterized protein n=1 Tax=Candidatus Termititenax persephonae TaxID=2218525 RepID=A0A388TIB0_9BACT|nr:hypothetical protein NO2_1173 [Candidatus Termititenax persephonae]